MAFITITGNAREFNTLIACLVSSEGTPGQLRAKDRLLDDIFKVWPELDQENQSVERIEERSEKALQVRELQIDTQVQGAMAETFLAAIRAPGVKGSRFRLFRQAARLIQVSGWWERNTTQKLQPFQYGDSPENYSDVAPAAEQGVKA